MLFQKIAIPIIPIKSPQSFVCYRESVMVTISNKFVHSIFLAIENADIQRIHFIQHSPNGQVFLGQFIVDFVINFNPIFTVVIFHKQNKTPKATKGLRGASQKHTVPPEYFTHGAYAPYSVITKGRYPSKPLRGNSQPSCGG